MFRSSSVGVATAIFLLLAAVAHPAAAWGPDSPAPPALVLAEWTADGTLVSWAPSVNPLAPPITGYTVYRMDEAETQEHWTPVGSTPPDVTSFLDPAVPPGEVAFYYVTASSGTQSSPPSAPAVNANCPPLGLVPISDFPFYELVIYWECLSFQAKVHGVP